MEAQTQMQIPVFNGRDYEIWSIKMKTLFMARDLWDVVESGVPDVKPLQCVGELAKRQKDLTIKDMTALHMLQTSVTDSIFLWIARATSSKQAWELLKAAFGETEKIRPMKKDDLMRQFNLPMEMSCLDKIDEYSFKIMKLVNKLRFYGQNIHDHEVIEKILTGLPPRFSYTQIYIRRGKLTLTEALYILKEVEASHNQKTL